MRRTLLLLGIWLLPVLPAVAAEARPSDPAASAPSANYRSAFEGYRPFREEPIADWKALNAEVGAAGGHIGIMGGARGHAGHGGEAKPAAGKPAMDKPMATEAGQAPVRSAPGAPPGKAPASPGAGPQSPKAPAGGAHSQH